MFECRSYKNDELEERKAVQRLPNTIRANDRERVFEFDRACLEFTTDGTVRGDPMNPPVPSG